MQSNGSRALVALAAIALVVVAFFVLKGDDDAGEGSGADPDPPAATTTADEATNQDEPAEDKPAEEPEIPTIVIKDGAPADGVTELEFDKGDVVRFAVESNIDQEIHVHGYEIEEEIPAGETVTVQFAADLDGIYEIESHTSEQLLAELRVNP